MPLGKVHLDIARANPISIDLDIAIRNELRTLREEAERFRFWLPEGVGINPKELANWWISLDYTGRTTISTEGLAVGVGEAPESKEGQGLLALDKKFEAELRSRADVPDVISKLRRMAAMGNMEQGRTTPFSLGVVDTAPDTAVRVEAPGSDPAKDTIVEQPLLDNANGATPHTPQDQIPHDEAVDTTVLHSTASNARPDPIGSAEENSTALGQDELVVAETAVDNGQDPTGSVQVDSPSVVLTAEGGGAPNLIHHSTAEVKIQPPRELADSHARSDPKTDDSAPNSSTQDHP